MDKDFWHTVGMIEVLEFKWKRKETLQHKLNDTKVSSTFDNDTVDELDVIDKGRLVSFFKIEKEEF